MARLRIRHYLDITPEPSFFTGVASIMHLRGRFYRPQVEMNSANLDFQALKGDWVILGNDMRIAMGEIKQETPKLMAYAPLF